MRPRARLNSRPCPPSFSLHLTSSLSPRATTSRETALAATRTGAPSPLPSRCLAPPAAPPLACVTACRPPLRASQPTLKPGAGLLAPVHLPPFSALLCCSYYWISGRVDDVMNVSGHRIGTAEASEPLKACSAKEQGKGVRCGALCAAAGGQDSDRPARSRPFLPCSLPAGGERARHAPALRRGRGGGLPARHQGRGEWPREWAAWPACQPAVLSTLRWRHKVLILSVVPARLSPVPSVLPAPQGIYAFVTLMAGTGHPPPQADKLKKELADAVRGSSCIRPSESNPCDCCSGLAGQADEGGGWGGE